MRRLWVLVLLLAAVFSFAACGDDVGPAPPAKSSVPRGSAAPKGSGSAAAAKSAASVEDAGAPLPMDFAETDFVESDQSRDPFRDFAELFVQQAKTRTIVQRKVRASQYALDELHLSGIVPRGEVRALVVDPAGLGWVLRVGDYVGKAELVSTGGPTGVDVALNWRVDRIRETDVVFLREDPAHPEIAPTTRVMYLHPVETEEGIAPAGP